MVSRALVFCRRSADCPFMNQLIRCLWECRCSPSSWTLPSCVIASTGSVFVFCMSISFFWSRILTLLCSSLHFHAEQPLHHDRLVTTHSRLIRLASSLFLFSSSRLTWDNYRNILALSNFRWISQGLFCLSIMHIMDWTQNKPPPVAKELGKIKFRNKDNKHWRI